MSQFVELVLLPAERDNKVLLRQKIAQQTGLAPDRITHFEILKSSLDARARQPVFRLRVEVYVQGEIFTPEPAILDGFRPVDGRKKVIVVGAGPAGYFAALELIELGIKPIVLDRGKDVRERRRDLRAIQQYGIVNPHSNYCFGEGGAGAYSDGKLYTRSVKRGDVHKALKLLVEHGAKSDILVEAHPHIGSNKLPGVVQNIRETIIKYGGEVHFGQHVVDFIVREGRMLGVVTAPPGPPEGGSAASLYSLLKEDQRGSAASLYSLPKEDQRGSTDSLYSTLKEDQRGSAASLYSLPKEDQRGSAASLHSLLKEDQRGSAASLYSLPKEDQRGSADSPNSLPKDVQGGEPLPPSGGPGGAWLADAVILATGHSARDIYRLLHQKGIRIEAKPFALGVRVEHPQPLIDGIQYKQNQRDEHLPPASYNLVCRVGDRGVFSFCMCPGGLIVPAATAPGEIVVNGMSMSRRDSPFANSGMVSSVEPADLKPWAKHGVFSGMTFQAEVEQRLFQFGDGSQKGPALRLPDFIHGKISADLPPSSYIPGLYPAPLYELLPAFIYKRLRDGLSQFGKMMRGFYTAEANVVATESRTSAPVRIPRDPATLMHPEVDGLFPCGEGAGYAGGIISAAMDGQNVARAVAKILRVIKGN